MKKYKYYLIASFFMMACLSLSAQNNLSAEELTRKDLQDYAVLIKKQDKQPKNIQLLLEATETIKRAAGRVYFKDKMSILPAEKIMIFYTYVKQLQKIYPYSYDIRQFAGYIFSSSYEKYLTTYELNLVGAEARLYYSDYQEDVPKSIYQLKLAKDQLSEMVKYPVSPSPYLESYRKWTQLDVSEANRIRLQKKIETKLSTFSGEDYYEAANQYLNYYLDFTDKSTTVSRRHIDCFLFAMDKATSMNYPDASCLLARYRENSGDLTSAMTYYRQAADKGGLDGKINVARMLIYNEVPNYIEATQILISIKDNLLFANRGGAELLGYMYENGFGVKKNSQLALDYYSQAYKALFMSSNESNVKEISKRLDNMKEAINRIGKMEELKYLYKELEAKRKTFLTNEQLLSYARRFGILGEEKQRTSLVKEAEAKSNPEPKIINAK